MYKVAKLEEAEKKAAEAAKVRAEKRAAAEAKYAKYANRR